MKLLANIGSESLHTEYKIICLPLKTLELNFTNKEFQDFLYNRNNINLFLFNQIIYTELNNNLYKYIPRYLSIFSGAKISGELYFGIDDDGNATGIPLFGQINSDLIREIFMDTMSKTRGIQILENGYSVSNQSIKEWYYTNTCIKIIKLKLPNITDSDFRIKHLKLLIRLRRLEKINYDLENKWIKYKLDYLEWQQNIQLYVGKLHNYLLNSKLKNGLIKYIQLEFKNNLELSNNKLPEILNFFANDSEFFINVTFTMESIIAIKDIYSPIKWIIKYKDFMINKYKKLKPIAPTMKPDTSLHLRFCNNIINIITQLMISSNSDDILPEHKINFYVIKFTFPYMLNTYMEFHNSNNLLWYKKKRVLLKTGPSCTNLEKSCF
jgi:hypothetical protein